MLENQKLKLENQDLASKKSQFENSRKDMETEIKRLKEELYKEQDEVKRLTLAQIQTDEKHNHQIDSANKEIVQLKVEIDALKQDNTKFRDYVNKRATSHQTESDLYKKFEARNEQQKKRVQKLLDYKAPRDPAILETVSEYMDSEAPSEDCSILETPSRSHVPASSEDAFAKSNLVDTVNRYVC